MLPCNGVDGFFVVAEVKLQKVLLFSMISPFKNLTVSVRLQCAFYMRFHYLRRYLFYLHLFYYHIIEFCPQLQSRSSFICLSLSSSEMLVVGRAGSSISVDFTLSHLYQLHLENAN